MFSSLQNTVSIDFNLIPEGPVLVRAQSVGLDPGLADVEFQRTTRHGERTVFLAGSGLKGVVRSHFERLLHSADRHACDPTDTKNTTMCGHFKRELGKELSPSRPHGGQCGACYTFGSLKLAGRFRINDAFPTDKLWKETNVTEVRAGVGIERKSQGSATGVLYDIEVVVEGGFKVRMTGENFSLWQVGLILQTLADLDDGFVQIGGCKSRGMGTVKVRDLAVKFRFLNKEEGLLTGAEQYGRVFYDLPKDDQVVVNEPAASGPPSEEGAVKEDTEGLFRTVAYTGSMVPMLRDRLIAGPFHLYRNQWS